MSTLADKLYPTHPEPAAERAPTPPPMEALAARLYKAVPPVDLALKPAFVARETELADVLGETEAQRTTRAQAHSALVHETGLNRYDLGQRLYHLAVDADLATTRAEDPIDDAQLQRWGVESRQQLATTYGRAEAEKLLARADKFTKAHPKLHELLGRRGIGSRPEIVTAICAHVRDTNYR